MVNADRVNDVLRLMESVTAGEKKKNLKKSKILWLSCRVQVSARELRLRRRRHRRTLGNHPSAIDLSDYVRKSDMRVKNVDGDGNCFFHAIERQLRVSGQHLSHSCLRADCDEMLARPENQWLRVLPGTAGRFRKLGSLDVAVSNESMYCLAKILGRRVVCVQGSWIGSLGCQCVQRAEGGKQEEVCFPVDHIG